MTEPGPASVSRTVHVDASPEQVWALVSDLPGMGALSPESTGGRWVSGGPGASGGPGGGGTAGPAVGAVFAGTNAQGRRSWSTRSTVVRSEPGRAFAFEVTTQGLKVAQWSYDLVPDGEGCALTETWLDRRGRLIGVMGRLVTGVADREAFTATSIEQTLEAVRARFAHTG